MTVAARGAAALKANIQPSPPHDPLHCLQGFSGVRFNPALWPDGSGGMDSATGRALYAKAGELGMPVSFLLMDGDARQTTCVLPPHGR